MMMKVSVAVGVAGIVLLTAALHRDRASTELAPERVWANSTDVECTSRSPVSRWVAASGRYSRSEEYGRGEDWLATISGVDVADGRVFVYDEGAPAIVELTPKLERVHQFGRRGPGPGEITGGVYFPWIPLYWDFGFLGFDGNTVAVYDREEIEVFDPDGTPRYQVSYPDDSQPAAFGLRYVRPDGAKNLLVVTDSVDFSGERPRRFQVWRITAEADEASQLVWEIPLPTQEGPAMARVLPREARPFWAHQNGCQVAIDGASLLLYRFDRSTQQLDSLALPEWEVPAFGDSPDDRTLSLPGVDQPDSRPSALARWKDLVIDPDGWAWIRVWTPQDSGRVAVLAVSLQRGEIIEVETPAFPRAFGDERVFYSVERDPETDEQLIVRYEGLR